jgi:hypothetical protein
MPFLLQWLTHPGIAVLADPLSAKAERGFKFFFTPPLCAAERGLGGESTSDDDENPTIFKL